MTDLQFETFILDGANGYNYFKSFSFFPLRKYNYTTTKQNLDYDPT